MRVVSLNTWGGKLFSPLIKFLKKTSSKTDIFCFQEVLHTTSRVKKRDEFRLNLFAELELYLADFRGYMAASERRRIFTGPVNFHCDSGSAIFVRKSHTVRSHKSFSIGVTRAVPWGKDGWKEIAQCVTVKLENTPYIFCNIHGIADWPKIDTPERLEQSYRIICAVNAFKGKKIVCGDFNLNPKTESVRMFKEAGMRNLVREYRVQKTRSSLFYKQNPGATDKISDYMFISPDITVNEFATPAIAISDHLPLMLDFS